MDSTQARPLLDPPSEEALSGLTRRGRGVEVNRVYVIGQIRDLRDWVLFVRDSLQADRPFEKGKRAMLEAYMGLEFLKEAERDSLALAKRLEQITRAIQSSVLPAQQAGILSR